MRVLAVFSLLYLCFAPNVFGGGVAYDFCSLSSEVRVEFLNQYAPLIAPLPSPDADLNGYSSMKDEAQFKCEVGGNGMPDCSFELGLIAEILKNPNLDLTEFGGVSHAMVSDAFAWNNYVLQDNLGPVYDVLSPVLEPLLSLICGYMTIGDGAFDEVEPGQFEFSGSGGYAISLIYALPTETPLTPEIINLASYSRLPEYLAPWGDADGNGYSNYEEFLYSESVEDYLAGALDPTKRGSFPISSGEGEGEGEAGDPANPSLPAAGALAAMLLFSACLILGILLHPRAKRVRSTLRG